MLINKKLVIVCILLLGFVIVSCEKKPEKEVKRTMHNHSVYSDGVEYKDSYWEEPDYYYDNDKDRKDVNIKGLWIRSDYQGEESYFFSYLGIPNSEAESLPAVLLIHGGGGTAYWEWVKMWMDRGYVALAIDLEGHVPLTQGNMSSMPLDLYENSPYSAPHNQNYEDAALPIEDTWMHYATRSAIIANSFLHNLDYVDKYKIGVSGVSWGGIITSIITGYDNRFAFSIPIYCSLNQLDSDSTIAGYMKNNPEAEIWDNDTALSKINTPTLFVASNIDIHARLDSISKTYENTKNSYLSVIEGLLHSQAHAAALLEPYTFADSIVKNNAFITLKNQPDIEGSTVGFNVPKKVKIDKAYLFYTTDQISINMNWSKQRLVIDNNKIDYEVSSNWTAFYLTIIDNYGNRVSSKLIVRKEKEK